MVNKSFVLDSIDKKIEERIVCLYILEGTVQPALPLKVHQVAIDDFDGTVAYEILGPICNVLGQGSR